jgi:hypothetical protein
MDNEKFEKGSTKFVCLLCDYNTIRQGQYDRHLLTLKHKRIIADNKKVQLHYDCNCGKSYNYSSGLCKHKIKCTKNQDTVITTTDSNMFSQILKQNDDFKHLILEQNKMFIGQNQDIQKQNHDLQQQILDVCKNGMIQNNSITNNSHNKTFNLQVFLNEECKDAMNISEFMSSIQVQLEELECVGRLGFVEGISKIIIKNLKALDIRKRPVHCTDLKRETVYIKENGVWVKDDDSNTKLRKVIKNVSFRNSKNTRLYRDKYPDCVRSESRLSDIYSIIIIEAMGGGSKTDPKEEEDKILRRILKELVIDKSRFLS